MQVFLNTYEYFPVPGDIFTLTVVVIGPGSQIVFAGNGTTTYSLVLRKDYSMYVPAAGTISLKGMNYDQIREKVLEAVNRRLSADFIDFQFYQPVSFQVLVNGLVQRPGPASMSSIMRVSDAIQSAGGLIAGATTRRIVLQRADGSERAVDMLAFQRNNQKEANPLLLPGDRIIVGQNLKSVRIEGAVLTPGLFELLDAEGIPDLVGYANGLSAKASKAAYRVIRAAGDGSPSVLEVEYSKAKDFPLLDGDAVQAPSTDASPDYVTIDGPFYGKPANAVDPVAAPTASLSVPAISSAGANLQTLNVPGPVHVILPHHTGMNVYEVMERLGGPTQYARGSMGKIYDSKGDETASFDPLALWQDPEKGRRALLRPGDYLLVTMKNQVVSVAGEVFIPRVLAYMEKRPLRDYLALSGGVKPSGVANTFTVYDSSGGKKKAGLDYVPAPEDTIMVGQNGWAAFLTWWSQPGPIAATTTVVGFLTVLATLLYELGQIRGYFGL